MLAGAWANLLKPMAVDKVVEGSKKASQASPASAVGPKRFLSKCEKEDLRLKTLAEKKVQAELKQKEKEEREAKKAEKEAMPDKPKCAYVIFSTERREAMKEANPEATPPELMTLLGAAWKELTEEEKAPFEAKAAEDKERYAKECEAAGIEVKQPKEKKPPKEKKELSEEEIAAKAEKEAKKAEREKRKAEKEAMPAKAKSAYAIYTMEMRESTKADHPDVDAKELVKILSSMWAGLSEDDKLPFEAKAVDDKERYERECEAAGIDLSAKPAKKEKAKAAPKEKKEKASGKKRKQAEDEDEEEDKLVDDDEEEEEGEASASQAAADVEMAEEEAMEEEEEAGEPAAEADDDYMEAEEEEEKAPKKKGKKAKAKEAEKAEKAGVKQPKAKKQKLSEDKEEEKEEKAAKAAAKAEKAAAKEAKEAAKAAKAEAKEAKEAAKAEKEAGPKKAQTAYMIFSGESRARIKEANPEAPPPEVMKLLAAAWKELTEEEKAPFEAKAAEDKERYAKECEAAGIEVKQPKEKAEKAEGAPKEKKEKAPKEEKKKVIKMTKPPKEAKDVYAWHFKGNLMTFAEAHSDMGTEEIKAALIEQYDSLSDEEKAPYIAKAKEDAERFEAEQAGWEAHKAKGKK